ncbi:MAG: serine/threonine protein phosphatase [Alphaproteobacteria bacterium]|nr:serine/threonine protein phosphatase [Alphaproteobacteria bacterium]
MVRSFFSWSKVGEESVSRSSVPAGQFVVAIGDVHGRLDLLEMLWHQIDAASRLSSARHRTLIFLGDYIDRGLYSAELVDRLLEGFPGFETIYLKGNHDETLLRFLTDPTIGDVWRNFGGLETLRSYGVSHAPGKSWSQIRSEFADAIPKSHVDFFKNLKLHVTVGDYLFVHAGLKPRVPLEEQRETDMLWIREEFLDSTVNFGRIVVHGHTPTETPDVRPNRIGIDTGAYMTGTLTALVLEERSRSFLSTS